MPPLGECKSRIQYYKPEPCEAEIEACLSRPPLLPAQQFWVTLSVSGSTWASFLPCERLLSFSARYHTQTSSLFFLSVRLRPLSPPPSSFCSSIQIYPVLIGWNDTHTLNTRAGQKAGIYRIYNGTYLHSKDNLYIIWLQNGTCPKQVEMRKNLYKGVVWLNQRVWSFTVAKQLGN